MNLLSIILENPPKDDEKQTDYFERLSEHINKSPSATSAAVKRLLSKEGYKMSINGLRSYLNQTPDKTTISENKDGKTIEYTGEKSIQSLEQAIEFFKIDLNSWQVKNWVANSWDVTSAKFGKRTNYQVKLWLIPAQSSYEDLKKDLSASIPIQKIKKSRRTAKNGSLMLEPCIFDHHFGKVGFDPKTMDYNWSLKKASEAYHEAINTFLSDIRGNSISEIVLPIGNDYFNIDTPQYTTTKGTPQMSAELWQKIYVAGCKTKIIAIQTMAQVAPVRVYVVPGNHDHQLAFTMGEYLQASFAGQKYVTIENTPEQRKYHSFGDVLTGYTHGDKIKPASLHHTMSVDVPALFGKSKVRHFKVGHLHKDARKDILKLDVQDEFNGVSVFWCPSLSPIDVWHYQKLFIGNERRSKAFVYHKKDGLQKIVYFNLRK